MSIWNSLTRSLGLLGKPTRIANLARTFGSAFSYTAIQIEHDGKYDPEFQSGDEEVLLFTDSEISRARKRALKNPEDVTQFLKDHWVADSTD